MASYTDQIMQFNPYVPQLPLEAMAQVGMYKQQKYEENVQKIQSQIDNIAGLDVMKPLHKQYLQSKLDELGGKLKTVAASDFSNFQLVNSVSGMANQVVKDPVVQNALYSTQRVRKEQMTLEDSRKNGKSSIQNEEWWSEKVLGGWLNDGSLTSQFTGRYTQYRDMEGKLREVAEKIKEMDSSIDIPYIRDNNGNTIYFDAKGNPTSPALGKPRIDDAMLRVKTKGKSAQKLLDNFYISLDEDDKQQLKIDGWYHYKGTNAQVLRDRVKGDITKTFDVKKKIAEKELIDLTAQLATNSKLTTDQKTELQAKIDKYSAYVNKGGIGKELSDKLSSIDRMGDDDIKSSVYSEKFLVDLAEAISNQSMEISYVDNPYFKSSMDRRKLQFDYWKASEDFKRKDREYGLEMLKFNYQVEKDRKATIGANVIFEDAGLQTEGKEIPSMNQLAAGVRDVDVEIQNFKSQNGRSLLGDKYEDLTEQQRSQAITKMLEDFRMNPTSISDNNKRKLLERYDAMQTNLTRQLNNYVTISKSASDFDRQIRDAKRNAPNFEENGRVVLTGEEMLDVASDDEFTTRGTRDKFGVPIKGAVTDWAAYENKYKGTKYEVLARAMSKRARFGLASLTPEEAKVINAKDRASVAVINSTGDIGKRRDDFLRGQIGRSMPQYQMEVGALNMADEPTKQNVDRLIGNMYAIHNELGVDSDKFDPDLIASWRSGKGAGDVKYVVKRSADLSSGSLQIIKGTEIQEIPLNPKRLQTYFPNAASNNPLSAVKGIVMSSPTRTTNAMGVTDGTPAGALNSAFSGRQLPLLQGTGLENLVRFDIEGDVDNIGDDNDLYQIRMYVNDNGVWKSDIVNKQGYLTLNGVFATLQNIGTRMYEDIKSSR